MDGQGGELTLNFIFLNFKFLTKTIILARGKSGYSGVQYSLFVRIVELLYQPPRPSHTPTAVTAVLEFTNIHRLLEFLTSIKVCPWKYMKPNSIFNPQRTSWTNCWKAEENKEENTLKPDHLNSSWSLFVQSFSKINSI